MDFYEIFTRAPVNGAARNLGTCKATPEELTYDELALVSGRMQKERVELAKKAGIRSKRHRKNLCRKIAKDPGYYEKLSSSLKKWWNHGQSLERVNRELERLKNETLSAS